MKRFKNEIGNAVKIVEDAVSTTEKMILPVRQSVFRRFPVLFTMLVSFGAVATFLGIEQLLLRVPFFNNYPEALLSVGLFVLAFTGKLYQKLG